MFKLYITTVLSILALFAFNGRVFGLDPTLSINKYAYDSWTTREGLPLNWVDCIIQTHDKYIWLGTSVGLVRFDGLRFTLFDKANTPALKGKNIIYLYEARDNSLWIGTLSGGVTRLKDGLFQSYTTQDGLPHNNVQVVLEDKDGAIWIGTEGGLVKLKDNTWTTFTTEDGLLSNVIEWLIEGPDKSIWIGTPSGINRLKDGRFTSFNLQEDGIDLKDRGPIYWDRQGTLWVVSESNLRRFKDGKLTSYSLPTEVRYLNDDKDGNLWIVGEGAGTLMRLSNGELSSLGIADGLAPFSISSVMEDHEGSLWITFYGGGLARLKDVNFKTFTSKDGLEIDYVDSIFEAQDGALWIRGTRYKDGKFTIYPGLSPPVAQTKDGTLWFGGDGLKSLKNNRINLFRPSIAEVRSLYTDSKGRMWIGKVDGSIAYLQDNQLTTFQTKAGLPSSTILTITEDIEGSIWFGTFGGGLTRYRNGEFKTFTTKDGLSSDSIEALYADKDNSLWIGTNGEGLNRFKNGAFKSYTIKDGLFDDVTFTLLEDNAGNLWMGSEKGVYKVSKRDFDRLDNGEISMLESVGYNTADGIKTSSLVGHAQRVSCKTRDGKLWFGTIKGLVVVDSNNIRVNDLPPPVYIEEIIINKQPFSHRENIEIPAGDGELRFSFSALSLLVPERVRFRYRLEGFDKGWIDAGSFREARYTNIPPGKYSFIVIASNNDGVWNDVGAGVSLYLKPHFYQTPWFYILIALLLTTLFILGFKFRMRQLKAEFSSVIAERSRIARELHDTLLQDLVGLGMQLEAISSGLLASPQMAKRMLEEIVSNVEQTIAEARRSVWNLRSQVLEASNLPTAISSIAKQLTAGTGIDVQFQVNGPFRTLPSHLETNILRIGQEAITNAIKHANPSQIKIELEFDSNCVNLYVYDDGIGIDHDRLLHNTQDNHFGLVGMRERAREEGGEIYFNSRLGEGTEILLSIPLPTDSRVS
jgi:signal transduction histidine kinase/ligand-binding sensor domain-containing protein